MENYTNSSAMQQAFQQFDWGQISKNVLFLTYYINDLVVTFINAILKGIGTPYSSLQATVIVTIFYMVLLYFALSIIKPALKWGAIIGIAWLIIGFFKV